MEVIINALLGGILIGLAASALMVFNGQVAGISGIFWRALNLKQREDWGYLFFLGGLVSGGGFFIFCLPVRLLLKSRDRYQQWPWQDFWWDWE